MNIKINVFFDIEDFENYAIENFNEWNNERELLKMFLFNRYNISITQVDEKDLKKIFKKIKKNYWQIKIKML